MANELQPVSTVFRVRLNNGTNANGTARLLNMTLFSGMVKPTIAQAQIDAAVELSDLIEPLLEKTVNSSQLVQTSNIVADE